MNMKHAILLTALSILAVGCGPAIQSTRFRDTLPEPTTGEILLFSSKLPECPYDELGLISGKRRGFFTSLDDVLGEMRERAREMGGHAIVGMGASEVVTGATELGQVDTTDRLAGTVIRFTDPDCRR